MSGWFTGLSFWTVSWLRGNGWRSAKNGIISTPTVRSQNTTVDGYDRTANATPFVMKIHEFWDKK
ncbi:MAG: hypothetical protein VB084_11725 [Syntrophomonadaceae bacterium]|nr:hypothetical protein [Syntrophomonadaceae bacterium]